MLIRKLDRFPRFLLEFSSLLLIPERELLIGVGQFLRSIQIAKGC
jgi:hypothetical protein